MRRFYSTRSGVLVLAKNAMFDATNLSRLVYTLPGGVQRLLRSEPVAGPRAFRRLAGYGGAADHAVWQGLRPRRPVRVAARAASGGSARDRARLERAGALRGGHTSHVRQPRGAWGLRVRRARRDVDRAHRAWPPARVVDQHIAGTGREYLDDRALGRGQIRDINGQNLGLAASSANLRAERAERFSIARGENFGSSTLARERDRRPALRLRAPYRHAVLISGMGGWLPVTR